MCNVISQLICKQIFKHAFHLCIGFPLICINNHIMKCVFGNFFVSQELHPRYMRNIIVSLHQPSCNDKQKFACNKERGIGSPILSGHQMMGLSHSSYNFLFKSFTCLDASCISVPSTNRDMTSLKEQPDSAVIKRDSTQVFSCDGSENRKAQCSV